jgi:L-arabinose isomerase
VANEIDAVTPPAPLPRLPVARAVWQPRPNLHTSTEAWLAAGGPHHTVYTSAVNTETLSDLAEMVGVELLVIDANTDVGRFSKELRWNQAYFRLAQGL